MGDEALVEGSLDVVVESVRAECGEGLFEGGEVLLFGEECFGGVAVFAEDGGKAALFKIVAVGEGLVVRFLILLVEDPVSDVRKDGVRYVVKKAGYLFCEGSVLGAEKVKDAERMVVTGEFFPMGCIVGDAVLMDVFESLKGWAFNEFEKNGFFNFNGAVKGLYL